MKKMFNVFVLANVLGVFSQAHAIDGDLSLSASSIKLKVYKMAVSTSPLCTGLITVLDNGSTPTEVDFLQNPSLGSGTLADGTYPCIVVEMSDQVKFNPSANSTSQNCQISTQYVLDVCSAGSDPSTLIDGTSSTCAGSDGSPVDNKVAMYISTASTGGNSSNVFARPTSVGDTSHGLNLGAALTISGTSSGKFVVNSTGKVCDGNSAGCEGRGADGTGFGDGTCQMGPPVFSFSKL